jgi:hypothetical protein
MERGVYFDAWFPGQHCYHPSLPPRRLRMVEHLVNYHATVLVWAALGGGSISLPYLEQEAFGEIDPRFRFYGFLNDAEFIAECRKHGIKVFGIVFEVQGWEFPVELNEDEDRVLALNETRGVGKQRWLGLREFSQNRYPNLWPPFEHYFPGGLVNSDGEPVGDLLDEACSRDIYGMPCHAHWVECPDREHYCYTMDRNNPVWREYLKAIIRIQIDAGVDGVQLDEAELPLTTLQYGGCFCKDCLKGFRAYLQSLPADDLPAELLGVDLDTFHYGEWLLDRGYDFKSDRESTPLFQHYLRFQRAAITRYFAELADYARDYAAGQGKQVLVSGNFFNLLDQYYALEPKVDLIITEMRNTRYRQPAWYRYVAGFAGLKPVVVVENPYGGVVPEMVADLKVGRGYDRFRMSLYEAAALGANMSVPYGAWLGSVEQDAFYPPDELCVEIQDFLANNEPLFSRQTGNDVAVVYSIESEFQHTARRDQVANDPLNLASGGAIPFWSVCEALCDASQPYDVLFFPDGDLRKDALRPADLAQYRTVILPDCAVLTPDQARLLHDVLAAGARLLVLGELGSNLPPEVLGPILDHPGTRRVPVAPAIAVDDLLDEPQVRVRPAGDLMINVQRVGAGAAVHLIRYDFDPEQDRVPPLPELAIEVRLPERCNRLSIHSPGGEMTGVLESDGRVHRMRLNDVPLYGVALLEPA